MEIVESRGGVPGSEEKKRIVVEKGRGGNRLGGGNRGKNDLNCKETRGKAKKRLLKRGRRRAMGAGEKRKNE